MMRAALLTLAEIICPPRPPTCGYVDIGSECFGLADGSVLCWRGENYVPQRTSLRVRLHNRLIWFADRGRSDFDA